MKKMKGGEAKVSFFFPFFFSFFFGEGDMESWEEKKGDEEAGLMNAQGTAS